MGELTAKGGGAGNMVAQGWVLAKDATAKTVTVGDGNTLTNIFIEKYTLASDAKIYVVNNWADWKLAKAGTFDDIKVTAKDAGGKDIYYTPDRYAAVCIFDKNYQSSWKDGTAKVKELYVFNNPTALENKKDENGKWISQMYTPDGVQYDGTSWYPLKSKEVEGTQPDYGGSAFVIEMMKNRLYSVGDNYTHIYLFVGADGTLSLLDMGNASAAYQYPLNVAKAGFDPRKVTNIFLTHGHGDHYGAFYEFCKMIRQAGIGAGKGWINPYATGATIANSEASFTLGATITDKSILYTANNTLAWDTWLSFLGPDISTYIWRAMGHSNDTASFVIKIKAAAGDAFFRAGDVVSWVYFGGYAVQAGATAGFARNGLINSLQNQQSVVVPWAQAQSDYVYPLYQHTNQGAALEVEKATKILGIPYMQGYIGGAEEIGNYCENRISQQTYERVEAAYQTKTDLLETTLWNTPGSLWTPDMRVTGTRNTVKFDSNEKYGPFKRKGGQYTIDVKGTMVVHGYNAWQNPNFLFAGLTNVYGWSLDKGFVIPWNTYSHDPDGWYVQVFGKVNDSYKGGVDQATNWYTLEGNTYMTGQDGTGDKPVNWTAGPIEICNTPENWYEILRTERFSTQGEAETYAKALTANAYTTPYATYAVDGTPLFKYSSNANQAITDRDGKGTGITKSVKYKVNLDNIGQIKLGTSFQTTFVKQ
jgi:glyoxylase-like metal-dependent hydrolase (beta-lactamase superfamily II)